MGLLSAQKKFIYTHTQTGALGIKSDQFVYSYL